MEYDIYGNSSEFTDKLQGEQMEMYTTANLLTKANVPQVGGTIRPGVMTLKKGATASDIQVFKKLVAENAPWVEIDKALGVDDRGGSKLRPLNVDYFSVHQSDFINPDNAKIIMERYADSDGKLRKFPVWFPFNNWWQIIFHNLAAFGKTSGIKYRSVFVEKREGDRVVGIERVCQYPAEYTEDEKGIRKCGPRVWNTRGCNPEACPEYQKQDCRLRGRIYCYVPGVKGLNLIAIPTSSWYSLNRIKGSLDLITAVTNGRIPSIIEGKTVFVIRKRKDKIPVIDIATGETRLREQYLIELDLDMDMLDIAKHYTTTAVVASAMRAQNMLSMPQQSIPPQKTEEKNKMAVTKEVVIDFVPPANVPPANVPPVDVPPVDVLPVDVLPVDVLPVDVLPVDVPPANVPPANVSRIRKGPATESQIGAIVKRAKTAGVPDKMVQAKINGLSYEVAAEIINALNKKDYSIFLTEEAANEEY